MEEWIVYRVDCAIELLLDAEEELQWSACLIACPERYPRELVVDLDMFSSVAEAMLVHAMLAPLCHTWFC